MPQALEGKIAVITGGSRVIVAAIAKRVRRRTERTWPSRTRKVSTRPRRSSRKSNALAERRSQFSRTLRMPGAAVQTDEDCAKAALAVVPHAPPTK